MQNIIDVKSIVSNDKDYLQLINENILVYRPTERMYYDYNKIKDQLGSHKGVLYLDSGNYFEIKE